MRVRGLWNTKSEYGQYDQVGIEVHVSELLKGDIIWGTTWFEPVDPPLDMTPFEVRAQIDRIEEGHDENGRFFMLYYDDEHQPARLHGSWAKVRTTSVQRGVSYPRSCIVTVVDVNNEREEFLQQHPDYKEPVRPAVLGRGFRIQGVHNVDTSG